MSTPSSPSCNYEVYAHTVCTHLAERVSILLNYLLRYPAVLLSASTHLNSQVWVSVNLIGYSTSDPWSQRNKTGEFGVHMPRLGFADEERFVRHTNSRLEYGFFISLWIYQCYLSRGFAQLSICFELLVCCGPGSCVFQVVQFDFWSGCRIGSRNWSSCPALSHCSTNF